MVSIEPSAQLVYAPYNEGTLEDNDLIAVSMPLKLARKSHALTGEKSKALAIGLARAPTPFGPWTDNGQPLITGGKVLTPEELRRAQGLP